MTDPSKTRQPWNLLQRSENLRRVLEGAPISLFAFDLDGRLVLGRGVGETLVEKEDEEWAGSSVFEMFADHPEIVAACRRALRGEGFTAMVRAGDMVFESRFAPMHDADGELVGTVGAALDATRRERAVEALRSSEERFRAVAEGSQDVIFELTTSGRVLYLSPSVEAVLGHQPEDLMGCEGFAFVHADEEPTARANLEHAVTSQDPGADTWRLRHADGSWRWAEATGRIFQGEEGEPRVIGVLRDVTERRRAQEALERQLDLEHGLAELSRGFLEVEGESIDDAVRRGLASASNMAGADRSFLLTVVPGENEITDVYEWHSEDVPARGSEAISSGADGFPWALAAFRRGEILQVARLDEIPPEGEAERVDLARRGVRSLLGIPVGKRDSRIGYLSFERVHREKGWTEQEVTLLRLVAEIFASALRRKHTEEALRESQVQLFHSQKMEAVGRLAGGIAHDFNNLLTVILGCADSVTEAVGVDLEVRADAEEISASARRAAGLTRQLLTFSRRQVVQSQPLAINDVITGLEKMLERVIGEDVELYIRLDSEAGLVEGDPGQIEQVVANLAVNARDAMPGGGRLEIRTAAVDLDASAAARLGLAARGRYVLLSVEDTGHGMDEATIAQAFDPFFTTKEVGQGTGLGLSVVYSIVEQAGGAIGIRTRRGGGTCFEIHLPVAKDEAAPAIDVAPGEAAAAGGETVLLVEDERAVRNFVRRILENAGYHVLEAGDGIQALEVAERCEAPAHLLVSDVVMPGSDGPKLARELQRRWPGLRVLFMSGYPIDHLGAREKPLPPEMLLPKPFTHRELLDRVRSLLAAPPPAAEGC